jgi:hypothetical protein
MGAALASPRAARPPPTDLAGLRLARALLRRLVGPLTLFDPADTAAFVDWETSVTPAMLEGLTVVASLTPASWNQIDTWLRQVEALRQAA